MKKNKLNAKLWELIEEEEGDIYEPSWVESMLDSDEINAAEEGFMVGFLAA